MSNRFVCAYHEAGHVLVMLERSNASVVDARLHLRGGGMVRFLAADDPHDALRLAVAGIAGEQVYREWWGREGAAGDLHCAAVAIARIHYLREAEIEPVERHPAFRAAFRDVVAFLESRAGALRAVALRLLVDGTLSRASLHAVIDASDRAEMTQRLARLRPYGRRMPGPVQRETRCAVAA